MARLLDTILVIDLESTCWEGPPPSGQMSEIIEIGLVTLDVATLERVERQSIFIRPMRSEVSEFCTELTTLTADDLKDAGSLADAVATLKKEYQSKDRLWASWGDYDRRQFERVCEAFNLGYPFGRSHLNVKTLFSVVHNLGREFGLEQAHQHLGRQLEGTLHRGVDDAWNIAGLLADLLRASRGSAG